MDARSTIHAILTSFGSRHAALLVVLILQLTAANAQVNQTHRFEIKHRGMDEPYSLIPLKEEGIALFREKNEYDGPARLWELTLLNTNLKETQTTDVGVNYRYPFIGYEHTKNNLYLLFRTGETSRNSFFLIHLTLPGLEEVSRKEINPELDFKLAHFNKVGDNMVFGGYVSNEPAVFIYEMESGQLKVIPGFFQKDNELIDLRVNHNETFNTVLIDRSMRNERKLIFRTFDETGKMLLEDVVPVDEDFTLQSSITSKLEREDLLLTGTWGDRQGNQSSGFFAMPVDPFSEQKITYLSFGQLEHFTDHLNPKRAERIKENAREDAREGKKPSFMTHVMPYRLSEHLNGYVLLAEVYDPEREMNPYYNSPYNNPYYYSPYYYNPFWPAYYYPGMRMYRPMRMDNNMATADVELEASIVVAFDPNGNLLWDQSLSFDEVEKSALEQVSDYYFSDSRLYILYKKESELLGRAINIADGTAEEIRQDISTFDPVDEIRSDRERDDGLRHWVDNTFYLWGYQSIKNVQNKDDRVRNVFYINKIVVE